MSDTAPRLHGEHPDPATRAAARAIESWLRLRIAVFSAIIIIGTILVLDFVLMFVLPVPEVIAQLSRRDLLMFGPVALVVMVVVTAVELRSVAGAVRTLKLGLRLSEVERQRSLRAALSVPVTLPLFVLGVGTAGNVVTLVLDLFGRSPTLWYSLHATVVTQCMIICACFPVFVFTRFTLRPFIKVVARDSEPLGRSVGLRGRIALLLATLVCLVTVPAASLLSLQLDAEVLRRFTHSKQHIVRLLSTELQEMGLHSFRQYVQTAEVGTSSVAFLQDTRGRVEPRSQARLVNRAGLPPPAGARPVQKQVAPDRYLVAIPLTLPEGGSVWVGMTYDPQLPRAARRSLVYLMLGLVCLAVLLGLVLGAGIARELRAVAGRLESLSSGERPEPLSGDVGSVSEIGRLIDGINELLATVERRKLHGFVQIETAAESARSKTQFLANMSHDLKAPLTAVLGFVEFLQSELNGPLKPAQRDRVERIAHCARQLECLITVLLDRAKLESGGLRLERAWTPPATLVSRAMDRYAHQLGEDARHRVRIEVQPGLAPIYVDPERTAQAIALLLYLLEDASSQGRARSGALAAVSGEWPPVNGDAPRRAPLVLRTARFQSRVGHGTEITVACLEPGAFDPTQEDLFVDLRVVGKQTRFLPAAVLVKQLITRQRGLIQPFREAGGLAGFRVRFPTGITGEMPAVSEE